MNRILCVTIRFVQPFPLFHGRRSSEEPEWPPSPMRTFQALVNAASLRTRGRSLSPEIQQALKMLEVLRPEVIAPKATVSNVGYRSYVPHNQADLVTAAWHRGNLDASIASHRIEKDLRPLRIESDGDELPAVHYLYSLNDERLDPGEMLLAIRPCVRAITHLGWGIDQVAGDATLIDHSSQPSGERWLPSNHFGRRLRVPRKGSLDALTQRYGQFLNRLREGWTPVSPLTTLEHVPYHRDTAPIPRPCAVFKLVDENDDTVAYPHAKMIHVAGMVRHAAIELMKRTPPREMRGRTAKQWIEQYVAGHLPADYQSAGVSHAQFSYVPLPSTGAQHTDPGVRRVMIVAPLGNEDWLEHLAQHLDGQELTPLPRTMLPPGTRLQLISERQRDGVRDAYTRESKTWASFTPVILPGHSDHKPEKTRKLILAALAQSGIEQPCEFEWSSFSQFGKSYSAHKYDNQKRLAGYVRPDHLMTQTAVHLTLRFKDDVMMPGPLVIGAGRHCGFGLLVATSE